MQKTQLFILNNNIKRQRFWHCEDSLWGGCRRLENEVPYHLVLTAEPARQSGHQITTKQHRRSYFATSPFDVVDSCRSLSSRESRQVQILSFAIFSQFSADFLKEVSRCVLYHVFSPSSHTTLNAGAKRQVREEGVTRGLALSDNELASPRWRRRSRSPTKPQEEVGQRRRRRNRFCGGRGGRYDWKLAS